MDHSDLSLGTAGSRSLAFQRSYNSSLNLSDHGLGYGWNHSYDIKLGRTSNWEVGLGERKPVDASSMIMALFSTIDLMKNEDNILGWVVSSLIDKQAVDQLVSNAVTVQIGTKMSEFVALPDGTWSSPPGVPTKLVSNPDGTFSLKERFGSQFEFDTEGKISRVADVDGNATVFNYSVYPDLVTRLSSVQDAVGHTLSFQYTGNSLTSVTDSSGRAVSYAYDAVGNLSTYTDTENAAWTYGVVKGKRGFKVTKII